MNPSWTESSRAFALHEVLDLGLRCSRSPNDAELARRFASIAAPLAPLLVARLRLLEEENEQLRRGAHATEGNSATRVAVNR